MPARPERRPRVEAALKRLRRAAFLTHRRADDGSQPVPPNLETRRSETGLRKTSVTRELPVGDAGHAPSAFARPLRGRPDNSSLHDVNAGPKAGRNQKSEIRSRKRSDVQF
jgi:hypothetical protein